ncbi:MAG: sodium:solute symporter, partial [Kiritimatiellae bacterium]|nr:sodium:solute symporter [Kiritimatiellia bacterium]
FVIARGCYFLGGFGRLLGDQVDVAKEGFDAIVPTMLSNLGPGLVALTVVLVLSASMSTLSSLVITSSSTLTSDFVKTAFCPGMKQKTEVLTIRLFVLVFIAISAVLAMVQHHSSVTFIAQLMGISWGALAGSFLAPFLYSLYWKGTTKAACWASFVFGSGLMIVNMVWRPLLPQIMRSPINCGSIAMLAGLAIVPLVSAFTRAPTRSFTDRLFSCYDRQRTISAKTALGD